jgi:hypothetical protein
MVSTHVLSHMCIFLECHRENKLTSCVQHLTLTIKLKSSQYDINDIKVVMLTRT